MTTGWNAYRKHGKLPETEQVKKLGLLVVDDETEIVESLREVFRNVFDIYHTDHAPEALALFKEHGPKLVLSDQRMPDMTGLELLREIKEIDPSTVRILLTGYSDINIVVEALNDGLVWKYVAKPWNHEELRDLLLKGAREYLRREGIDETRFGFAGFLGA